MLGKLKYILGITYYFGVKSAFNQLFHRSESRNNFTGLIAK